MRGKGHVKGCESAALGNRSPALEANRALRAILAEDGAWLRRNLPRKGMWAMWPDSFGRECWPGRRGTDRVMLPVFVGTPGNGITAIFQDGARHGKVRLGFYLQCFLVAFHTKDGWG